MLDTNQSAQGLNSSAHTQISPPKPRIIHKGLRSHIEWLGGTQDAVERLCKWSGTSNPWERGWGAFYRNLEKLAVGAVRVDWSIILVWPVWRLQTGSCHFQKETIWFDKFGLGPGHVQCKAGQVRWSSNSNGHIVHQTYLENLYGIRWRDQTSLVDWTCSGIGRTGLTGMQNRSNR
jgi:hypothetical protein